MEEAGKKCAQHVEIAGMLALNSNLLEVSEVGRTGVQSYPISFIP